MMYNLKNAFNKVNKQKITHLALASILLVTGIIVTVSVSHVANAAVPVIEIVITDADEDVNDQDDETTLTREKTVTASDSANSSNTTWKHKRITANANCDSAQMSAGTRSGNQVKMSSETYNNFKICFEAINGSDSSIDETGVITGIDRKKPNPPTAITLDGNDDTGVSNSDGLTSNTSDLTITGCAETDSRVEILLDGQSFSPIKTTTAQNTSNCTADGTAEFSINIDLAERSKEYVISAVATDEAGNVSSTSSSRENARIIIDTTAPTVALTHRLTGGVPGERAEEGDITYLNAGDTIAVTMTFTEANGMSDTNASQPIVAFYNDSSTLSSTATVTGTSNIKTATYTISDTDTIANNNLRYDITNETSITDRAGNELAEQNVKTITNAIVDTTKPAISSITFATTNEDTSWAAESDEITTTITFSEKISEKVGNTDIFYRLGNSGRGQRFAFATGRSFTSGQCQETGTTNQYECKYTVKDGDAGAFQVSVNRFTDYAGNTGDKRDFDGTITTDTSVTAPSGITLERGIKERDNEITPTFIITVGESGGEVILYSNDDCSAEISTATPVTDTIRPFTVEVQTDDYEDDGSDDGVKTVYATHEDDAGNISACSTVYGSYTLDTSAPIINELATGYYSDADATKIIPLINGRGKITAGDSIYTKVVFDEEVKYRPGSSASALPEIKYSIGEDQSRYRIVSYASTLSGGRCKPTSTNNISDTYICQYRVQSNDVGIFTLIIDTQTEDLLEHTLEETYTHEESIILDNTAPEKPSDLELSTADDSGNITDDNITNKTTNLTIEGCAETGSTVQLYANGTSIANAIDVADNTDYGCTTDDNNDGFSITISLTEGVHKITAKATDESGNTSSASDALSITIDTTAPTAILTGAPSSTNNIDTLDVTVEGTDVTHYQYAVFGGDSCTNANYLDGDTAGTAIANKITTSVPNQDGSIILCVVGRDKTGNWQTKADATIATWTRDKTKPTKPTGLVLDEADDTGLLTTDGITKKTTALTIAGCAEADSTVEILKGGSSFKTKVMDIADTTDTACTGAMKKFSADISLTEGDKTYTISAIATDQSGNVSEESDALTIEIKTTAPSITAINLDLADDDDSGTNTSDNITNKKTGLTISGALSGTPSANDYVQLYDGTKTLIEAKDSSFTGVSNSWSIDIDLSEEGAHTINAKVLDAAGNEGTTTSMIITIDTTGPTVSVTEHISSPTTDVTPDIKIQTSAAGTVSFGGACTDTSKDPTRQTVTRGENTITLPTLENKTYSDCTVMVRDETGNLSTGARINSFIVDNTPPTITAAATNNAARTKTKVTLNEQVYAPVTPSPSDFQIEIDNTAYADLVTGISDIAKTKEGASQSFTLTHSALPTGNVGVRYTKGTNHIFDQIGNTLETTGTGTSINTTQFVSVALHADDDTGFDDTDGLTRFDGDEVTLTISLNTGTFTDGDRVRVFMADGNTTIASYTISGAIVGSRYIDADGETIFDITLAKSIFKIGVNNVGAAYTKIGSIGENQGTAATITYDNTPPSISVQNPDTNPTLQKEVRATDNESGTTAWKYKVLTESIQVCNSATMNAGTTDYTEGNIIVFENTNDNGNRVCFSTTDAAGNTAYMASETLSGIDGSAPTVESVVTTSADRRTAQVILNEKVYATTTPAPSDFKVIVDNSEYPIVGIAELATDMASAKNTFTITLPSVPSNTQMALKYTQGTNKIIDIIGNQLASFTGQAINNMKIVSLNLDAIDDTGPDSTDNITRFDGDTVTLTASLNEGTFSNGDIIRLFKESSSNPVQIYTISNLLTSSTYKNATGEIRFTVDLPKHIFSRGLNNLSATYTPSGDNEGMRGGTLAITYDITEPKITVQNPSSNKEQQKIVSATDTDSTATVWQYKQIDGAGVCDATSMTDAAAYSEGATTIVLSSESDNGTKVCFSATDTAGNTSYKASNQLSNIDTTAPTASGASITTTARATTKVLFNEPIYATANINPNDFRIVSGQTQYIVTGITGLANSSNSAEASFTLAHVPLSETDTVNLQYTKGSADITDIAGNALQSFTEAVANRAFVTLTLDPQDDTGTSTTDSITQFDGDEVSLTISLTSGTFTNGDQIQIFHKKEEASLLKRIIIASAGTGTVNAGGTTSFTTTIAKQLFREGEITLYATYTPAGQITSTNGIDFSLTYDDTAPFMTIFEPDTTVATKKQIVVRDYDRSTTTGLYKIIEHDTTCDASALSEDTTPYIEGSTLEITSNDANGKKVCFSFTDTAGNSGYRASPVLQGIDSIAPTVSSAVIENYDRTRTVITFNEKVYASDDFTPSEFSIEIGNTGYNHRVSGVERLPTTSNNAIKALLLIHPAVSEEIESRITYTPGTGTIQDIAGNTLKEFTKVIENTSFITLDLADEDDTGSDKNDNYTRLEGSTVTLTVRLTNNATFSNSDVVTIYKEYNDRTRTVMKEVTVSTFPAQDAVNAHNNDSFAIEIPKNLFDENATTALSAGYAPFGNSGLKKVGSILQITVDTKDPTITITEADAELSAKKIISATGGDATETVWKYAQIQSGVVCNADALEFGKEYTKGTTISLDNESYNNTKICFSATDLAGNTTYKSSNSITGIDTEAPTVSSVSVTGRDELIVTMSEPVYAVKNPNPDDFVVFINNSPVTTTAITGIQNIARRATHEFSIIIDDTIRSDDTVSLSYIGSSRSNNDELVKDVIGNTLATFDKITSTLPSVLTIKLNPADDTGINTADGITRFSESSEVKFIVTLNKGTFKGGDRVRIYENNENKPIASVIVGIRGNEVNAHGETSLTATIAKKQFTEGPLTLHATYKPRLEEEGLPSALLSITYDMTAPSITTVNPEKTSAKSKSVSAIDGDSAETSWTYKQITSGATCNAEEMSNGTQPYTEGEKITFNEESDNSTKVCFSAIDQAGNAGYERSAVLKNIDTTAPTITIVNPDVSTVSSSKKISATDNEKDSQWTYQQISENAPCDASTTVTATSYTEGTDLTFDKESDNNTKVCFTTIDVAENTAIHASVVLMNIKEDALTITTTTNPWTDFGKKTGDTVNQAQAKAVIGTDGNDTETTWFYKQIAGNAVCNAAVRNTEGVKPYTEGEPIVLREETDNGTKICFISVDQDGKITATASEIISGVDITMPTIIITETTKSVSARDTDTTKSTWTYKRITGNATCDADQMTSGAETYTETEQLPLDAEQHSGTKVCFSATDVADNTSYKASETLSMISATVNSWVDPTKATSDTVNQAQAKAVIGTDGNDTETTWFYKQIAGNAVCNAAVRNTEGVKPYTEGEPIVLREETDNGTKICFISVDQDGKITATASEIISGVDITMPTIIITNPTPDPAQEKVVIASDRDSGKTSWQYKQVTSETTCNSDALASATQEYTENTSLRFTKDSDNNTKVCFSVTDSAGNTAYATSDVLTGIDATAPTISSARLIDVNKTQTRITVNEHIYTDGTISPSDFKIEIEGVLYPATKISRFEQSIDGQETSFIITHPAIASETATTLSYVRGNVDIVDAVGNTLKDFSGQPLFDKSFVALSLDRSDDTGISTTDGITNFDDNEVTLIATISEGTFSNGDIVDLHKKGTARSIERILISGGLVDATNAHGESTFEIVIPRSTFTPNKETVLYTVYTPADGSNSSGQRGFELTVSYRTTAPQITVTTSDVSASTTTVQAVDKNEAGETTWHYKQIKSNEECTAETLSQEAHAYTEGAEISFRDETTNDTKACFSSVDIAGNASYATSDVIIIDLTAPSITVQPLTNTPKQAKIVRASDNDEKKTTWKYRVVKAEEVCDADTLSKSTRSYREGSGLKFDKEQANGHKICFSSTDTSGNVLYAESMTIQGIDTTAPRITVTMEGTEEKIIRARDTDAAESTSWKYRVIKANESCTAETIQENSRTYREGSGLVFRNRRANGYKVCFAASDSAGNMSYRASNTMQGIGKTSTGLPSSSLPSSNALQDENRPTNTASPLTPLSNPLYPITKTP